MQDVVLLEAADQVSDALYVMGGTFMIYGVDIGANDITIQVQAPDETWISTGTVFSGGTATQVKFLTLPIGNIRASVAVAAGPKMWITSTKSHA